MATAADRLAEAVDCFDPECVDGHGRRSIAEPEQDGSHRFWACLTCGSEFGHQLLDLDPDDDGRCAVGVPAELRRRASAAVQPNQPPLLQIGRRRAPAA